jgi:hypothetical protein
MPAACNSSGVMNYEPVCATARVQVISDRTAFRRAVWFCVSPIVAIFSRVFPGERSPACFRTYNANALKSAMDSGGHVAYMSPENLKATLDYFIVKRGLIRGYVSDATIRRLIGNSEVRRLISDISTLTVNYMNRLSLSARATLIEQLNEFTYYRYVGRIYSSRQKTRTQAECERVVSYALTAALNDFSSKQGPSFNAEFMRLVNRINALDAAYSAPEVDVALQLPNAVVTRRFYDIFGPAMCPEGGGEPLDQAASKIMQDTLKIWTGNGASVFARLKVVVTEVTAVFAGTCSNIVSVARNASSFHLRCVAPAHPSFPQPRTGCASSLRCTPNNSPPDGVMHARVTADGGPAFEITCGLVTNEAIDAAVPPTTIDTVCAEGVCVTGERAQITRC